MKEAKYYVDRQECDFKYLVTKADEHDNEINYSNKAAKPVLSGQKMYDVREQKEIKPTCMDHRSALNFIWTFKNRMFNVKTQPD